MSKPHRSLGLTVAIVLVVAGFVPRSLRAVAPNVLILVADDLGWADVPWRGSPARMPNLDRLRQEGTELMRYYAAPLCSPSRASLHTGPSAVQLGIRDVFSARDDGLNVLEHLIPETFRAEGYETALTGKWHLGSSGAHLPTARGFDRFYGFLGGAISYYSHFGENTTRVDWQRDGTTLNETGYSTDLLRDEEIRLLRTRYPAKPFFHVVTLNAPHIPLEAPPELLANYPALSGDARTYAAMLESLDAGIGKILAGLTAQRLDADTLVIFISDNGGPGNSVARNIPLRGAKSGVYEGGVRVPAILRWPGAIRAGATSDQFVSVQDLFPTVAAGVGVAPRSRLPLDGLNLWSILRGSAPSVDRSFTVVSTTDSAQFEGRWKLVERGNTHELYDVVGDPSETSNVAAMQPAAASRLRAALTDTLDRSLSAAAKGDARVTNLSARAAVGGAAGTPILGFVVAGGAEAPRRARGRPCVGGLWRRRRSRRSNLRTAPGADARADERQFGQLRCDGDDGRRSLCAAGRQPRRGAGSHFPACGLHGTNPFGRRRQWGCPRVDFRCRVRRRFRAPRERFGPCLRRHRASILIPGVAVGGNGAAGLLIRVAGPALGKFGVTGSLADPVLTVFRGSDIVASNYDWGVAQSSQYAAATALPSPVASLTAAVNAVGAFPFETGSRDAAVLITLPAGANYTVKVSGKNGTTGTVLVEFYLLP